MSFSPTVKAALKLVYSVDYHAKEAMRNHSREQRFTRPRRLIWAVLRKQGWSFPMIAKQTGTYDHSTIIYGIRRAYEVWPAELIERLAADMPKKAKPETRKRNPKPEIRFPESLAQGLNKSDSLMLPTDPKWALKALKMELRQQVSQ